MPPERVIEFKIELQPGTAPIAKATYKMSPMEMNELKIQLQGLLNKGYIYPSTSPRGCSALFVQKKDRVVFICGLLTTQCSHHQEQVSTPTH
jgi:hypothetical protein